MSKTIGAPKTYDFKNGDLVQCTRLAIKRQTVCYPDNLKTEDTKGVFVRYCGTLYYTKKHPTCIVHWYKATPPFQFEQTVRLDYIEPLGTPR